VSSAAGTEPADVPLHCANHPKAETYLRCSDCGKPICTDCMVQSAVGIKCRDCARLPRSARVSLKPDRAARAIGAAFVGGAFAGTLLAYIGTTGVGFLSFIIAYGVGVGMGRLVLFAGGRYRSATTGWIAAGGASWAYVVAALWVAYSLGGDARVAIQVLGLLIAGYFAYREVT
jgi:hypothetical protein